MQTWLSDLEKIYYIKVVFKLGLSTIGGIIESEDKKNEKESNIIIIDKIIFNINIRLQ